MSIDNPFFHRGAIRRAEEFHGREAEINQIVGLCRNGQSASIVGPRRIGKSSLLLQLGRLSTVAPSDNDRYKTIFALVDCQELGGSPPEEIYEALLTSVTDSAFAVGLNVESIQRPGTYRALDRALNAIVNAGISVVIILDEFELLAGNSRLTPYFFARLRGLTTKYGLAFLTASQRPLFAITADKEILSSPFFNIFVTLSLGLFAIDEALDLLKRRLEGTPIEFSANLDRHIISLVGTHPFFLHIAGYHAFNALVQEPEIIEADDCRWLDESVEIESESHLSYLWKILSVEEQYCLAIKDGPIDVLRQLEQQCLLLPDSGGYEYSCEMLRRFVRRQGVVGLVQVGPFVIDRKRHTVHANDIELGLTTSQFDLLVRLGQHSGQVVAGEDLEAAVWGDALLDDPDRLKTLIKRLRRAIEPYNHWIVSERGVGYALREPE